MTVTWRTLPGSPGAEPTPFGPGHESLDARPGEHRGPGDGGPAAPAPRSFAPSRRQALALAVVLLLVAGVVTSVSYLVRPDRARSFDVFQGSVLLADAVAPVTVDLASGRPTVRLVQAAAQVGATATTDLSVVPLGSAGHPAGTLLLNRRTGEFNMVAATGFVVKTTGGVSVGAPASSTGAVGLASGSLAYIERTGPSGTSVFLVDQSTVETANAVRTRVRPRASRSMPEPVSLAPGAAVAAHGDLWMLAGTGTRRTLRQLHLDRNSSPGAQLRSTDHGTVRGPAALATGTLPARDGGGTVVAAASADRVRLVAHDATTTVRFPAVAGADRVLAVGDTPHRLSFLVHGTRGWFGVAVDPDGSDLHRPSRLAGVPATDELAPPVASEGRIYTLDTDSGRVLDLDRDLVPATVPGTHGYPLARQSRRVIEPGGFGDAYLIARGPRVVVDSPSHLDALVLFTDGSRAPLAIAKSSAVSVNAASDAAALARSGRVGVQPTTGHATPAPGRQTATPVDNTLDCRNVRQKPHIPTIVGAVPGSRSVLLSWTYPTPDPQDCAPSTYVVAVRLLSAGAPAPPGAVRVQGQTSVELAGLFPSSRYEVTVSAYINGQGTASAPRQIVTGPEGPAAPKSVSVGTDDAGDWTVSFRSCGTAADGCVPAAAWRVVPELCDGQGLTAAPAPLTVTADPTTAVQPPARLTGGDALLGRGLRFRVEGIGADSTVGDPSSYTACVHSWARPVAAAMSLHASTEPVASFGAATTATVTLDPGADEIRDLGGAGAQITYRLLSGGQPVDTVGPTTARSVRFDDVQPGRSYTATAAVAPPQHPEAAVSVGPVDLTPAVAPWPDLDVTSDQPVDDGPGSATVTLHVRGLQSGAAGGERFDLTPDSELDCGGGSGAQLTGQNTEPGVIGLDPGDPITVTLDRTQQQYGSCQVRLRFAQSAGSETDPAFFGDGTTSDAATTSFTVDPPALGSVTAGDFGARWDGVDGDGRSQIEIRSDGGLDPALLALAHGWSVSVTDEDGATCGGYVDDYTLHDVGVDPSCIAADGSSGSGWNVAVSFDFLGDPHGPYQVSPVQGGAAPTYRSTVCDVAGVTASWAGNTLVPTVHVVATDGSSVGGCSGWTYTVTSPAATSCGTGDGPPPETVPVTCGDDRTASGWLVAVSYQDADGSTHPLTAPVLGTPP